MWNELYQKSDGFLEPSSILPSPPLSFAHIASTLYGATLDRRPGKINYFRGYVDGREDYTLAEAFLNNFKSGEDDVAAIIHRFFSPDQTVFGKRAGLIINGSLQWSEMLQERMIRHAQQMSMLFDETLYTLDLTLFIGAYGQTPFGVHLDDTSHRTILYNLGPGTKGIAIWDNEAIYEQFGPVHNVFDPSHILAEPRKYHFEEGKAFVLPSSRFHLGLNEKLSTTAAFVIDLISEGKAIGRESETIFNQMGDCDADQREELNQLSAARLLALYRLRVRSNHMLRYAPMPVDFDIKQLKRSHRLSGMTTFCLETMNLETSCIVYSRGRHHLVSQHLRADLLRQFFSRDQATVAEYIDCCKQQDLSVTDALRLLLFLIQSGSVGLAS